MDYSYSEADIATCVEIYRNQGNHQLGNNRPLHADPDKLGITPEQIHRLRRLKLINPTGKLVRLSGLGLLQARRAEQIERQTT